MFIKASGFKISYKSNLPTPPDTQWGKESISSMVFSGVMSDLTGDDELF